MSASGWQDPWCCGLPRKLLLSVGFKVLVMESLYKLILEYTQTGFDTKWSVLGRVVDSVVLRLRGWSESQVFQLRLREQVEVYVHKILQELRSRAHW
jgi:hypothetical protein